MKKDDNFSRYLEIIKQTIIYFTFSTIPFWALVFFKLIINGTFSYTLSSLIAGFVPICIPVLVFGLASPKPTKEKGAFKLYLTLEILAYSLSVILILAQEVLSTYQVVGSVYNELYAWVLASFVFIVTFFTVWYKNKEDMMRNVVPEDERRKEERKTEDDVFKD